MKRQPKERSDPMRAKLKAARKAAGLTQQAVAERLGVSLRYYQQIEQGIRTGDFQIWDGLEEITGIHQRVLREKGRVPTDHP